MRQAVANQEQQNDNFEVTDLLCIHSFHFCFSKDLATWIYAVACLKKGSRVLYKYVRTFTLHRVS